MKKGESGSDGSSSWLGKLWVNLRAEGLYAVIAILGICMAAIAIWGRGDNYFALGALAVVMSLLASSSRKG